MDAEYKINDYYVMFINQIKQDIKLFNDELAKINPIIDELNKYITNNRESIKEYLRIDIDKYPTEIIDKKYNTNRDLEKLVRKLYINWDDKDSNKKLLLNLLKYCEYLKKKNYYSQQLSIVNDRVKITFKQYKEYIKKYYYKVHEVLMKGYGYKFGSGIGVVSFVRIIHSDRYVPTKTNYNETRKAKLKLIEMGLKPYNREEARIAEQNNEEYDGVRYRILLNDKSFLMLRLTNSYIFSRGEVELSRINTCARKFKGLGYKRIGELYTRTVEDIAHLDIDLRTKLNIMLDKFPHLVINFITIDNNDYLKKDKEQNDTESYN